MCLSEIFEFSPEAYPDHLSQSMYDDVDDEAGDQDDDDDVDDHDDRNAGTCYGVLRVSTSCRFNNTTSLFVAKLHFLLTLEDTND